MKNCYGGHQPDSQTLARSLVFLYWAPFCGRPPPDHFPPSPLLLSLLGLPQLSSLLSHHPLKARVCWGSSVWPAPAWRNS